MTKCLNEMDFNDIVKQAIWAEFDNFAQDLRNEESIKLDEVGEMSPRDERICKDAFKGEFDVDLFLKTLANNIDFREKIESYVENL